MRTEPPPSLPIAKGHIPAATAAAEPALEPPGDSWGFHGLRVGFEEWVVARPAVAELGRIRLTDDHRAGGAEAFDDDIVLIGDEVRIGKGRQVVRMPAVLTRSLIPTGTPARGPGSRPARTSSSTRFAATRATSGLGVQKAWSTGSSAYMRSSAASATSTAEILPARTSRAIVPRPFVPARSSMAW